LTPRVDQDAVAKTDGDCLQAGVKAPVPQEMHISGSESLRSKPQVNIDLMHHSQAVFCGRNRPYIDRQLPRAPVDFVGLVVSNSFDETCVSAELCPVSSSTCGLVVEKIIVSEIFLAELTCLHQLSSVLRANVPLERLVSRKIDIAARTPMDMTDDG
jgi:hypothetical protein